jgi:hypothetical protein
MDKENSTYTPITAEGRQVVFTDEAIAYSGLQADYTHRAVNHMRTYVDGNAHTNTLENFWSLLKRGIKGTYVSVDPVHLQAYLGEQAFRFNERKETDFARFAKVLGAVAGRGITYRELTA